MDLGADPALAGAAGRGAGPLFPSAASSPNLSAMEGSPAAAEGHPGEYANGIRPPLLAFAACTGLMFGFGAPPGGWWWLYWLAFAPLVVVARSPHVRRPRQAALYGLVGGLGIGLVGFEWIGTMLVKFVGVPWAVGKLGLLFFAIWLAVPYAIWAVLLHVGPKRGWLADLWAVVTFVPLHAAWPVLFPYTPVLGLAEVPELMQPAEIGGSPLLETIMLVVALLVIEAQRQPFGIARGLCAASAAAIPVLVFSFGFERMAELERLAADAPTWRVGVVQPNVPVGNVQVAENFRRLRAPSVLAEREGAEVIVWPEAGTYPYRLPRPLPGDDELGAAGVRRGFSTQVLFGVGTRGRDDELSYNTFAYMDGRGRVRATYDKVRLVPIGERIPLVDPDWAREQIPWISHLNAGDAPTVFDVDRDGEAPVRVGPLICLEDILADYAREVAAQEGGVDVFVNSTIDAWYGYSAEPWEHLALAQIRSVENRVPTIRSVSTGVSAVIDHLGRLQAHIPSRPVGLDNLADWPPEHMVVDVVLARNTAEWPTPFVRWGYLYPWLCGVVAAGIAFVRRDELLAGLRGRS